MNALESIPVRIGQVKIGRAGQELNAILGSCIGIGFLFPDRGVFGLAHALLAEAGEPTTKGDGRHVDQAIQSLLRMMEIHDNERRKLHVFLTGGANMTMPVGTDPKRLVGSANSSFAVRALKAARLRLSHEDMGGENGRRVTIDCTTGNFSIDVIPRLGSI